MKRIILVLIALLLVITMFVGCDMSRTAANTVNVSSNISGTITNTENIKDKFIVHYATCLRQKDNGEAVIGEYITEYSTVTEINQDVVNAIEEEMKLNYPKDFYSYLPEGVNTYRVLETVELKNSKSEFIILKGKINDYNFYTFYDKTLNDSDSPQVKSSTVVFVFELDGDTSYMDLMVEKLEQI